MEEIVYYTTLKEFPGHPIGSQVWMFGEDGNRASLDGEEIPFEWLTNTEWFKPVYLSEYKTKFKNNSIRYIMKNANCGLQKAQEIFESMFNK